MYHQEVIRCVATSATATWWSSFANVLQPASDRPFPGTAQNVCCLFDRTDVGLGSHAMINQPNPEFESEIKDICFFHKRITIS